MLLRAAPDQLSCLDKGPWVIPASNSGAASTELASVKDKSSQCQVRDAKVAF